MSVPPAPAAKETAGARPDELRPLLVALLLLAAAAFLVFRAPRVVLEGRFWAEEGTVYFASALADGPAALLRTHQGYLNLATNLATGAAALPFVPLEAAPRVTVLAALLFQLLPAFLLLTRRAPWLASTPVRLAAVALVLLARPSDEVWLNSVNSHFFLAVATAILLATDRGTEGRWSEPALLAVASLSSVTSALLAPLAWAAAARERTRRRLGAALLLTAGALLQAAILLPALVSGGRTARADADLFLPAVLSRHVVAPFVSDMTGSRAGLAVYAALRAGRSPSLPSLAALAALAALGLACRRARSAQAALLAASAGLLAAAGYLGALGADRAVHLRFVLPGESERYAFAPNVLVLLALLALAAAPGARRPLLAGTSLALAAVAAVHALVGLGGAGRGRPPYYAGPSWRAEVAAWRADPGRPVRAWPAGWTVDLSPRASAAGPTPHGSR
ncbi:MAG: hypothetical protein ACYDBY_18055 [Thermoanaerobaculia bacterium]